MEHPTIRIVGLASGCRNYQKDHENRMNPMKTMPLCTGPPKTLTSPDNGVRCVRGRPLRADEPRTLTFEGLFAGPFHQGVAGRVSPPSGQRRRVLGGERMGQCVAVTAAIASSDNRSIEARWKLTGRNAESLRADGLPADAFKPRGAIDRVTPLDPQCRRSGVEKQHSCFKWDGGNSCPALHHVPLLAFEGNLRSEKLPLVFQGEVLSTQNGVRFRFL